MTGAALGRTTPVGHYPPDPFGLFDMHGNAWERCADHWHTEAYRLHRRYLRPEGTGDYVLRGGSYDLGYCFARCACRGYEDHEAWWIAGRGFRVAREL